MMKLYVNQTYNRLFYYLVPVGLVISIVIPLYLGKDIVEVLVSNLFLYILIGFGIYSTIKQSKIAVFEMTDTTLVINDFRAGRKEVSLDSVLGVSRSVLTGYKLQTLSGDLSVPVRSLSKKDKATLLSAIETVCSREPRTEKINLSIRAAEPEDQEALEELRQQAFAPVFSSFRQILGDEIYDRAQKREDEAQSEILASMFSTDSDWKLFVVKVEGEIVGFVSLQLNSKTRVGEIGLNAVMPLHAGKGIGTQMYEFAIEEMRTAGMKVATVATGGDDSHTPARRAYEKAGFNVKIPSVWMCRTI